MDLIQFLAQEKIERRPYTVVHFARQIGFTRAHVEQVLHGYKKPSLRMIKVIELATRGKVREEDMLRAYEAGQAHKAAKALADKE